MLIDSTVFRDYRVGDTGALNIINQVIDGTITASISPLTVLNLWTNTHLSRRQEMGYAGILSFLHDAPLSQQAAKQAGVWLSSVPEDSRSKLSYFALIAATARENGMAICTRNQELFGKFCSEFIDY